MSVWRGRGGGGGGGGGNCGGEHSPGALVRRFALQYWEVGSHDLDLRTQYPLLSQPVQL